MLTLEETDLDEWSGRRFPFKRWVARYSNGAGCCGSPCPLKNCLECLRTAVKIEAWRKHQQENSDGADVQVVRAGDHLVEDAERVAVPVRREAGDYLFDL